MADARPQPDELVFLRRHLPVSEDNHFLQRQQSGQLRMLAEGFKLRYIGRTVSVATVEGIKPDRQTAITGRQGEQLELLDPFALGIVPLLQPRHALIIRLVGKQSGKLDGHGIRMKPTQVYTIPTDSVGDQFAPDNRPTVINGIQHPSYPIVIELLRALHFRVKLRNGIPVCPVHHIV